jgi:hypothetical protein
MHANIAPFLIKVGNGLRGLQVGTLYSVDANRFNCGNTFLDLDTFIFDSEQLNIEHLTAVFTSTSLYNLRRLIVSCHDYAEEYAKETIADLGTFFSIGRFPKLELVIFFRNYDDVDSSYWKKDMPTLLAAGIEAFPRATIRVREELV